MENLLNILSNANKDIDNQKLMDYLSGKLSAEDVHEVEKWMIDNEFASEAFEGLTNVKQKKNIDTYVEQLNKELNTYLQQKKDRRQKKRIASNPSIYYAIIIILMLILLAFFVIQKLA